MRKYNGKKRFFYAYRSKIIVNWLRSANFLLTRVDYESRIIDAVNVFKNSTREIYNIHIRRMNISPPRQIVRQTYCL